jgi:hypothetical protein
MTMHYVSRERVVHRVAALYADCPELSRDALPEVVRYVTGWSFPERWLRSLEADLAAAIERRRHGAPR